ncbi:MAG: nucleotidyltransferase domain-containing protein [Parcubacteria group bacterium]|jgi:predicted nucleotidyltransferase
MTNSELQKNILTTVAYYDAMDYPMTSFEVWKYLTRIGEQEAASGEQYSLVAVMSGLENENLKKIIEEYRGFYFLRGRKDLVAQRLERNKISNQKIKKLVKIGKWLRFVPFVRMLAVTGSLAMKNAEPGSDLDLLVVLRHGKIFTGRFLVTALLQLLGKRRHGVKINNRACLNYFVTDKSLEISLKDVFSASEYSFMLPIFGWHNFQKFQRHNEWLKKYKPNFQPDALPNLKFIHESFYSWRLRQLGELIFSFNFLENKLKQWQLQKIEKNPKTHQNESLIIANDEMLIFLPEPQSPQIFEKFKAGLAGIAK